MHKSLGKPIFIVWIAFLLNQGCTHRPVQQPISTQSLKDKKVALVEIEGPPDAKNQIEIAVVNEIIEHGWFQIMDKKAVQDALVTYPTESDWKKLGEKTGADYILAFHVTEFGITERQGYDKVEEPDSELTEEMHSEKTLMSSYYIKNKSNEGFVKLKGILFDVAQGAITYQGTGQAKDLVNSRDTKQLGKLHLLEGLTNSAVHDFFIQIPE